MLSWVSTLQASVTMRESGPLVVLAGEADVTSAEQLRQLLVSQMQRSAERRLTVDVSELRSIDSSIVAVFVVTAKKFRRRGGELALLHAQEPVEKALTRLGLDRVIAITEHPAG